jgi:hypothetical protein
MQHEMAKSNANTLNTTPTTHTLESEFPVVDAGEGAERIKVSIVV